MFGNRNANRPTKCDPGHYGDHTTPTLSLRATGSVLVSPDTEIAMSRQVTPWGSAHSRGRRGPLTLVTTPLAVGAVLALTLSACGRSSSRPHGSRLDRRSSAAPLPPPAAGPGPGDFGTLKGICGPGTSKGNIGRGVTASTIRIGVTADPGAAAAPGLEQEFFDTADGFSKWCNAAGGINGRKVVIDKWDAKLFNVGQVMTDACQKDFMLVGNGNAFDSAGVKIRESCKLGEIPAYVVSPQAVDGKYQVQAAPVPPNYINNGAMRLLANAYPDTKTGGVGVAGSNLASLIPTGMKAEEYLKDIGIKVPVYQAQPPLVDNYRPYMEQMKGAGAKGIYIVSAQDPSPIVQAMKNVGWNPDWILYSVQFYGPQAVSAAKATPVFPPSYVQFTALPFELAIAVPGAAADREHRQVGCLQPEADLVHPLLVQRLDAVGAVGHRMRGQPDDGLHPAEGEGPH